MPEQHDQIPLFRKDGTRVAWTLVSPADYDRLMKWIWRLSAQGYAKRGERRGGRSSPYSHIFMAREIVGLEHGDPRQPDHINRNRLDNRRRNLRIASCAELDNLQNVGVRVDSQSGYRGVTWYKSHQRWGGRARVDGKSHFLGLFDTAYEAHLVVSAFRAKNMPFSEDARGLAA